MAEAVLRNPFAGVDQDDLTGLFEYGAKPGAEHPAGPAVLNPAAGPMGC